MAENKKSFVLYADYIHVFESLEEVEAGRLIKHILRYVNDQNPVAPDKITQVSFEPIKQQMKRDLAKWEEKKEGFSKAGKASATVRRLSKPQLYILKCFDEKEEFLKVGVTDESIGRRYSSDGGGKGRFPYRFEILHQYFPETGKISHLDLEAEIGKRFRDLYSYSPKNHFGGHMECYNMSIYQGIINFIASFNIVQHRSTESTVNVNVNVNDIKENIKRKVDELLAEQSWTEIACMQLKISLQALPSELNRFMMDIASKGELNKSIPDLKKYFINWSKFNPAANAEQKSKFFYI